jgi:hypothetical protein
MIINNRGPIYYSLLPPEMRAEGGDLKNVL